jgi:hypothetical protein
MSTIDVEKSSKARTISTLNPRGREASYLGIGDGTLKRWHETCEGIAQSKPSAGGDRRSGDVLDRFKASLD